jgi:photosystem II stability/assembly factor-like uncharacterized protein
MSIWSVALAALPTVVLAQSQSVATGTTASLRGLSAASGVVWASGQRGTVIRSVDGGGSWSLVSIPGAERSDVRAIHARTADVAHAAATDGKIWRTTDAGRTWSLRYRPTDTTVFLDAIAFFDDQRGLALGDPMGGRFLVLVTEDGGETWRESRPESRPEAVAGEAAFAASGTSLVVSGRRLAWIGSGGAATRVFRSDDGGHRWATIAVPMAWGTSSQGIFSLAFADSLSGIAVGGDYQVPDAARANAAFTTDGGRTWLPARGATGGYRSGAAMARTGGQLMAVATGTRGTDVSFDGGQSWAPLDSLGFNAIQFTSGGIAVAVGGGGRAARFDLRSVTPRKQP